MPVTIDKKWAAVSGDEIIFTADSKEEVERRINGTQEDVEIIALPKSDSNLYL